MGHFSFGGGGTRVLYSALVNISDLVIIWVRINPLFSRVELDAENPLPTTNQNKKKQEPDFLHAYPHKLLEKNGTSIKRPDRIGP